MKYVSMFSRLCGIAGLAICLTRQAEATVSFVPVTWGTKGETLGWAVGGSGAAVTAEDGYLSIDFPQDVPGSPHEVTVSNPTLLTPGEDFRGLGLTFDYVGYETQVQRLYFISSYGAGSTWYLDLIAPAPSQTWQTYNISFQQPETSQGVWDTTSGINFLDALSQVDTIGLYINTSTEVAMHYGLDNWQFTQDSLPVPEPEVTVMAAFLMLSLAFWGQRAFRARRG